MSIDSNFRRQDPSAETAPAGESGSSHSTAGAVKLSLQQKLDLERGITPERMIEFALFVVFEGSPGWKIAKAARTIHLTLRKLGFKIVPMEREDYERG